MFHFSNSTGQSCHSEILLAIHDYVASFEPNPTTSIGWSTIVVDILCPLATILLILASIFARWLFNKCRLLFAIAYVVNICAVLFLGQIISGKLSFLFDNCLWLEVLALSITAGLLILAEMFAWFLNVCFPSKSCHSKKSKKRKNKCQFFHVLKLAEQNLKAFDSGDGDNDDGEDGDEVDDDGDDDDKSESESESESDDEEDMC